MNTAEKQSMQDIEPIETEQSLVVDKPKQLQIRPSQADRLIELAITSGANPDYLDKLLDLKHKHDAEEARKAFTDAMARFKSESIVIKKDRRVGFDTKDSGRTEYAHASLGNIIEIATPYMSKHGLSARWETEQGNGLITVTCILTHCLGHSERTSLSAGADNSGKKNPIQQVASTITYLERYTFLAITGLAVKEQDDDGNKAGNPVDLINENQEANIVALMDEVKANKVMFCKYFKINSVEKLPAKAYQDAIRMLEQKRKKQ